MDAHSVVHTSTLEDISSSVYPENHIVQKTADPVSQPPYAYVKALLLFRKDVDTSKYPYLEILKLMKLFKSLNFEMKSYLISTNDDPQEVYDIVMDEQISITQKTRALGAPCLLIIYYAEDTDKDDGKHYAEPGEPQPLSALWRPHRVGGSHFEWHKIQSIFKETIFDLLLILDCSHVIPDASRYTIFNHGDPHGRIELLAATHDTAKIPKPRNLLFTRIITATMTEMITKFGRIEISKLHTLIGQQSPNLYTVPLYVRVREGASERAIMLERLHALGEQEQRVTDRKGSIISRPSAGGFPSRLNSLSYSRKESFRNDTSSQPPGGETIDSLDDFSTLKQRPRLEKTFPTRNIHTTKADTSYFQSRFTIGQELVKLIAQQLIKDTEAITDLAPISQIPPLEFGNWLEVFAWRLHGESETPLEWEASACLIEGSRMFSIIHGREPLEEDDLRDQTDTTGRSSPAQEWGALIPTSQRVYAPQLEGYEEWILKSDAYR
ncbi:hypothetical protein AA0120_g7206 [Alternaria tenuissima]|nr:hypothetical protein AA0120_g7206 [Alternaria tenuissima]